MRTAVNHPAARRGAGPRAGFARRASAGFARRASAGFARRASAGFSLIEMVIVAALLTILAGVALPVVKFAEKRQKEMELRAALREMRYAVDEFKRYSDNGFIPIEFGTDGYPKDLEALVEGVEIVGQIDKQIRFLRRVPIDPMTGEAEWGMRSYQDDYDAESWGGENVYDVYSLSEGVGLDDVPYREW